MLSLFIFFFFFNDTATTEIYTLSLHDALPISLKPGSHIASQSGNSQLCGDEKLASFVMKAKGDTLEDRKSTRLNSSHEWISYAVFCLKKKKKKKDNKKKRKRKYTTSHTHTRQ